MKSHIFLPLVFALLSMSTLAFGQDLTPRSVDAAMAPRVVGEQMNMSQGTHQALVVTLPNTDDKLATKLWNDFLKDYYKSKTKYNRKTGEYFTDDADIAALGMGNTVDMYAKADEQGDNTKMMLWVDLGGAYLSPTTHPERYLEAEKMMTRFAQEVARENVRIHLKDQEKVLKGLESDLKKLSNDNEKYHKTIEKAKEEIRQAEEDIAQNIQAQENKQTEIQAQQEAIERIQKKLKDM